jgi:hypothetical protein
MRSQTTTLQWCWSLTLHGEWQKIGAEGAETRAQLMTIVAENEMDWATDRRQLLVAWCEAKHH